MFDPYLSRRYPASTRPSVDAYKIKDRVAIVGIGQSEFSKNSGRSELQLACEAINAAVDGDTVLVKPGTYMENIDFNAKSITVRSSDGHGVTIIDGNQAGSVVTISGGEGEINGFTITNGTHFFGSGIRCESSSPTIMNNIITNNFNVTSTFVAHGGGISCEQSNARIICNVISHNRLDSANAIQQRGGGIHCSICNNVYIANNLITDNFALNRGGGISFTGSIIGKDYFIMENNTLAGNEAETGGGIYCSDGDCTISSVNEVLWDNMAAKGPEISVWAWAPISTPPMKK